MGVTGSAVRGMFERRGLVQRHLLCLLRPVLAIGLGVAAFQGVVIAAYEALEGGELIEPLLDQLEGVVDSLLGGGGVLLTSPVAYVALGWRHPFVLIAVAALAISRGTASVAGEVQSGTGDLLFSRPIPRWRILLVHWMTTLVGLADICLVASLGTGFWFWALGLPEAPSLRAVFMTGLMAFALAAVMASLAYLLSAGSSEAGRASSWAISLTLVFYLMDFVGDLWELAEPVKPYSIFHYYRPLELLRGDRGLFPDLYILLGLALLLFVGASLVLQRRDL